MRMERRLFRSLLLLSLVSLGTSCPALARTLYVIAGSDADARMGDGSADRPFTSLHEAVRQLEPGDELLLRAGTYALTEPVRLGPGGREDAWVTIKAAGDGRVVLDGSGLHRTRQINARLGSTGLLHIEGPAYVRIEGLTVQNSLAMGIFVRGPSHHVDIVNCRTAHTYSCGIGAWNTHHVRILHNEVTDANDLERRDHDQPKPREAPHEAISLGGVSDFEVAWNRVFDSHKEGIDVKEASRRGRVHHNSVTGMERQGLYADAWYGLLEDVSFDHNYVADCEWGAALSCEGEGAWLRRVWIHNNVIERVRGSGIYFGSWGTDGPRSDIVVAHNTIVTAGAVDHWSGATGGIDLRSRNLHGMLIANNIVVDAAAYGIGSSISLEEAKAAGVERMSILHNLVSPWRELEAPAGAHRPGYPISRAVDAGDQILEAPEFVARERGDYRLTPDSPGRGRAFGLPSPLPHAEASNDLGADEEALRFARESRRSTDG